MLPRCWSISCRKGSLASHRRTPRIRFLSIRSSSLHPCYFLRFVCISFSIMCLLRAVAIQYSVPTTLTSQNVCSVVRDENHVFCLSRSGAVLSKR